MGLAARTKTEVQEIVVPADYRPPGGCKFKARALHYAARSGPLEIVKLLLKKGADPTTLYKHGELPLDKIVSSSLLGAATYGERSLSSCCAESRSTNGASSS